MFQDSESVLGGNMRYAMAELAVQKLATLRDDRPRSYISPYYGITPTASHLVTPRQ